MSDYLPIDIVQQVLLRLPIKPLVSCSVICKAWYNLITSTEFIHAHLDFTKSLPNSTHLLIELKCGRLVCWNLTRKFFIARGNYVVYSDDKSGNFEEYVRFTIKIPTYKWSLVGCSNGLICLARNLSRMEPEDVVLWNPVIRRALRLPKSDNFVENHIAVFQRGFRRTVYFKGNDYKQPPRTFGFIFDSIGNDYKVLRNNYSKCTNWYKGPYIFEVFRSSTALWEDISHKAPFARISGTQADLKGIAHWIGEYSNCNCKIITFDVHEEVFGSIELPFDVVNDDQKILEKYIFVFEESLFLIHRVATEDVHEQHTWNFEVWRMGEYSVVESWSQVHTRSFDICVTPLGFRKNGEIIWSTNKRFSTNLVDVSHNYLDSYPNALASTSCLYAESLILLDKSVSNAVDGQKLEILQEHQCFELSK